MEFVELDRELHPFLVATQAHPEFKSRPTRPHPLFAAFVRAALDYLESERLPIADDATASRPGRVRTWWPARSPGDATRTPGQAADDREVFSVVSSERVFDGVVASVRIDEVVMPGGGTAKREVVEHGGAVAVVALDIRCSIRQRPVAVGRRAAADMIILIEQYRHPLGRRLWELPAGLLDVEGEPAQPAAARELAEETGYAAANWSVLLDVATSPGFTEETVRIFLATGLTEVGRPDSEHEEADLRVVRVPLTVAVEAVLAGRIVNVMAVAGHPGRRRRPARCGAALDRTEDRRRAGRPVAGTPGRALRCAAVGRLTPR